MISFITKADKMRAFKAVAPDSELVEIIVNKCILHMLTMLNETDINKYINNKKMGEINYAI